MYFTNPTPLPLPLPLPPDNIYNSQHRTSHLLQLNSTQLVVAVSTAKPLLSKFVFYDLESGRESFSLKARDPAPNHFRLWASTGRLVSVHENGHINIFCLLKMRRVLRKLVSNSLPVDFVFVDAPEGLVLTASSDDSLRLWSGPSLKFQSQFSGLKPKFGFGMSCVLKLERSYKFAEDLFVVSSSDGSLSFLKLV